MRWVPNVCCVTRAGTLLAVRDNHFVHDSGERAFDLPLPLKDLLLLELFAHESDPAIVFERIQSLPLAHAAAELSTAIQRADLRGSVVGAPRLQVILGKSRVLVLPLSSDSDAINVGHAVDLSRLSLEHAGVVAAFLAGRVDNSDVLDRRWGSYPEFARRVEDLASEGLLAPEPGAIVWGDFRRRFPFCQVFGYGRGTPIDRYYLGRFVSRYRERVRGRVLEVGGNRANRTVYGFDGAVEYRTLELPGLADDIAGDASDPDALAAESFDAMLAFHVLEHCERPQAVVDNMRSWLVPGGTALLAVPNAQKVHTFPADYWRPLPSALRGLFQAFREVEVLTYGNLRTVIGNLCGVAAEELTREELDDWHPDYPVLGCVVARK